MNETEKLILACFENFGYYIATDGKTKIEGKVIRPKLPKRKTKKKSKR